MGGCWCCEGEFRSATWRRGEGRISIQGQSPLFSSNTGYTHSGNLLFITWNKWEYIWMTEIRYEHEGIAVGIYCQHVLLEFNLRKDKLSFRVRMYLKSIYDFTIFTCWWIRICTMYIQNYEKCFITFTIFGRLSTCISMWSSHNITFPKFPFVVFISMDG